jgi:transcriptional regulator with XRE-family HTH domain
MHLGWYHRTARRIGKSVSQEELAEAVGISRTWYVQLEGGARTRPSTKLLDRLADVLMLDEAGRGTLFRLGIPGLRQAGLQAAESAAIDAFDWPDARTGSGRRRASGRRSISQQKRSIRGFALRA